jgi:predicted helicase
MSKAVARALAERCRALQASGLAADAAERLAFDELLSERSSGEGIGPHLYEDFLEAYAPEQRRLRGVYYTPGPVVAAQVRLAGDLLEQRLACPVAFGDKRVLVVDPATGSGAYPLAVIKNAAVRATGRRRAPNARAGPRSRGV